MSVRAAIVAILAANNGVSAIAGDRIRPMKLGQKDDRPAIIVNASETPWTTLTDGTPNTGSAAVLIQCMSRDSDEGASQLAAAVRGAVKVGLVGADRQVIGMWEDSEAAELDASAISDDSDDDYIETVTMTVHWKRVAP